MMLVQDIWLLASFCEEIYFNHVFREANFTDDDVADLGHGLSSSHYLWEHGLPLNCSFPFYFDLFGLACPRGFIL